MANHTTDARSNGSTSKDAPPTQSRQKSAPLIRAIPSSKPKNLLRAHLRWARAVVIRKELYRLLAIRASKMAHIGA
jgi:hypothetical protein